MEDVGILWVGGILWGFSRFFCGYGMGWVWGLKSNPHGSPGINRTHLVHCVRRCGLIINARLQHLPFGTLCCHQLDPLTLLVLSNLDLKTDLFTLAYIT